MNLVALHREKAIQAHHWEAAKWLQAECELHSPRSPTMMVIAHECRVLEVFQPARRPVDPFALIIQACVKHEPFSSDFRVVGVLREALNIVHRVMEKRKAQH